MKKRILSLVMALAMALTLLPMAAFATATTGAANDAYATGDDTYNVKPDTYVVDGDTVTVTITKNWVRFPDAASQTAQFDVTYVLTDDTTYKLTSDTVTVAITGNGSVDVKVPKGAEVSIYENGAAQKKDYVDVSYSYSNAYVNGNDTEYYIPFVAVNADTTVVFTNTLTRVRLSDGHTPKLNTSDHYAYIIGYPDGTIRPDNDITRAEVATMFFRMLKDEVRNENWSKTNSFSDVSDGQWFNNAISTLQKADILEGYPDGSFRPNTQITRAEFATIVVRFLEDVPTTGGPEFPDVSGHWASSYIATAAANGLVVGYDDGTFRPNDNITRAEAITMTNRLLGRSAANIDTDSFADDMMTWSDNPVGKWYYADIQEATNSHEYYISTTTDKEVWIRVIDSPDWYSLEKSWAEINDDTTADEAEAEA